MDFSETAKDNYVEDASENKKKYSLNSLWEHMEFK